MAVSKHVKCKACCMGHISRLLLKKRICPNVTGTNEPPVAEELRSIMSGNILYNDDGTYYTFINYLTAYPMKHAGSSGQNAALYFSIPTIKQLRKNTDWLQVNGQYLYPMLVWALKRNKPVIAMVSPGQKKNVKVVRKSPSDCLAYIIGVAKPD
jgi:hypothetical protein